MTQSKLPTQTDLNTLLVETIRHMVIDELVTSNQQRISMSTRLDQNGIVIDISDRDKEKKIILVYQNDEIVSMPKARRRINAGTRYIPGYVEITANIERYTYNNAAYLAAVENGYAGSILQTLCDGLKRELVYDTGYPICAQDRIYAKAGVIDDTENTFIIDHSSDVGNIDTEFFRVIAIDKSDCYTKEDQVTFTIADGMNYGHFLDDKKYRSFNVKTVYSDMLESVSVGDYCIVYHTTINDDGVERNHKVVRYIRPHTFDRWFSPVKR